MASFTKSFSFFITIILSSTLLLSSQIHARDSYFFGKFQRDSAQYKNPSFEGDQKTRSVEALPKKEQEQQDQDLGFIPESGKGYGLYGHETTYNNENNNNYYNNEEFNKQYEDNVNYEPYNTPSLSETEETYNYDKYSKDNDNYNNKNYYNSNAYGGERSSSSSSSSLGFNGYNNKKKNNVERQGMSDTRFVENGKYYFDINDENNHGDSYKKHYRRSPSYAVSNYDRFGQDNNHEQRSFQDPYSSKWENNMMNEQERDQEFGEEQQRDQFLP